MSRDEKTARGQGHHDEIKAEHAHAPASGSWVAVAAKKSFSRRSERSLDRCSEWAVTFVRRNVEGVIETKDVTYQAEHRNHAGRPRRSVYPSGVTASFKCLSPASDVVSGVESLGLKSYKKAHLGLTNKQVSLCQRLYFAYGMQFVTVKRTNHDGEPKVAVIQTRVGCGKDMVDAVNDSQMARKFRNVTDEQWAACLTRLIAKVHFFHRKLMWPLLDMKLDNLVPEFSESGELVDLHLIDLDDAVKSELIFTPDYLDADSMSHLNEVLDCRRLSDEMKLNALSPLIDLHSIARFMLKVFPVMDCPLRKSRFKTSMLLDRCRLLPLTLMHKPDASVYTVLFDGDAELLRLYQQTLSTCEQRWTQAERIHAADLHDNDRSLTANEEKAHRVEGDAVSAKALANASAKKAAAFKQTQASVEESSKAVAPKFAP